MYGLDCLGADEQATGKKPAEVIAEHGPEWISAIANAARGSSTTPTPTPVAATPTPTWVYPVVGVGALALVGGLIFVGVRK